MSAVLPAEVWLQIVDLLPQSNVEVPWAPELGALARVNTQLRAIALSSLLAQIYIVNPTKECTASFATWVEHLASLLEPNDMRARKLVVDSRCEQDDIQLNYISFLDAITPLERIIDRANRLRRLELRRISLTPLVSATLYRLQSLQHLEFDNTYIAAPPETGPRLKMRGLKSMVYRKQNNSSTRDDFEGGAVIGFIRAASHLYILHAEEPVLTLLIRQRQRLPVRSLVMTFPRDPRDMRMLLRCCPDLLSIEFASLPGFASVDKILIPKLERYRGPIHGMLSYVPGRPVHHLDIVGVSDPDQMEGMVSAARNATVPTRAFRVILASRGSMEFRARKLGNLVLLKHLEQLAVDSDFGSQTSEAFAREFTGNLLGSFPKLRRLDVIGSDNLSLTLVEHIEQREHIEHRHVLAAHRDPRLQSYWRAALAQDPPEIQPWEKELTHAWAEQCPELDYVSWGIWVWERKRRGGEDVWQARVRDVDVSLRV